MTKTAFPQSYDSSLENNGDEGAYPFILPVFWNWSIYKVTADAATLVQCDPALDQGGYSARAGQIIPSAD